MAERPSEVAALDHRLEQARASARVLNQEGELTAFMNAVAGSQAVMNRSLGALSGWLNDSSPLFLSYFRQLQQGRQPNGSEWDEQRSAAEATINPYCYQELNYAALTLDGLGMTYYGPYTVVLKEITIEDRASVFEENPFLFNQRHHVVAGTSPPQGYRASWPNRGKVAGAKLHSRITPGVDPAAFGALLMEERRGESDCDFVEVHIYGPVNREGLAAVKGPRPTRAADRVIWRQAMRSLDKLGTQVEELS